MLDYYIQESHNKQEIKEFLKGISSNNHEDLTDFKEKLYREHNLILEAHTADIICLALSSDDNYLISGGSDKTVRIWNLRENSQEKIYRGHTGIVRSVAISNDVRFIASAGDDKTIIIWYFLETQEEIILKGHVSGILSIAISNNNEFIISGGCDCTVRLWNLKGKPEEKILTEHVGTVICVAISNNCEFIASGNSDTIIIFSLKTNAPTRRFFSNYFPIRACSISKNNKYIAYISSEYFNIIDIETGKNIAEIRDAFSSNTITFTNDNTSVAFGGKNIIKVWDFINYNELAALEENYKKNIRHLVISNDNKYMIYCIDGGIINYWNFKRKPSEIIFPGHKNYINCFINIIDKGLIITGGKDATIRIWNCKNKPEIAILRGHSQCINALIISSNYHYIISAGTDQTVRLWNLEKRCQEAILTRSKYSIESLAITINNKYMIIGEHSYAATIWNLKTLIKSKMNK